MVYSELLGLDKDTLDEYIEKDIIKGSDEMNKKIEIVEVGPRDGLQNLEEYVPLEQKLKIIKNIINAGVKHIQHTSFVSPKAIPQMKDAGELTKVLLDEYPNFDGFFSLVPNLYGARSAYELGSERYRM